jgi:hypothetical protein
VSNYIDHEFDKVCGGDYRLKITSKGGETRWITIDGDSVDDIHALLAEKEEESE